MQVLLDIPEPLYTEIAQVAAASGQSVEDALLDRLAADFADDVPTDFWTPARMTELRMAEDEARAGHSLTAEQVDAHFAARREAWLQNHRA